MSEGSTKVEAVRFWWDKALESLQAARRELAADAYSFAINRAYYALPRPTWFGRGSTTGVRR